MKRLLLLLLIFLSVGLGAFAQKVRLGDEPGLARRGVSYDVPIHVYGLRILQSPEVFEFQVDITVNTRKVELSCAVTASRKDFMKKPTVSFGEYRAHISGSPDGNHLGDVYSILLTGNRVLNCDVTGIFE